MVFRTVRKRLGRMIPSDRPGIIQASYGRSGSTMMYNALAEAMSQARFGRTRPFVWDESWTLGEKTLRKGIVYKTHDYPQAIAGRDDLRCVFVFGAATDAALSVIAQEDTRGRDWIDDHLDHLKAPGSYDDILTEDSLGIARQLEAWSTFDGAPVLCLRYEGLWDNLEAIRDFAEVPVTLPPRRPRAEKPASADVTDAIRAVYGPIDRMLDRLPDVFRAGPEMAKHLTSG